MPHGLAMELTRHAYITPPQRGGKSIHACRWRGGFGRVRVLAGETKTLSRAQA